MEIKFKRSDVLESNNDAKKPLSDQIEYGEVAFNYNAADPTAFLKSDDNLIIEILGKYKPNGFSGDFDDLDNAPEFFSGNYDDLTNKPPLFSGSYNDLTNTPTIGEADITITYGGESITGGTFNVNEPDDITIDLPGKSLIPRTTDEPQSPAVNDLWFDLNECPPQLKIWSDCLNPDSPGWITVGGQSPASVITFDVAITDNGGNYTGNVLTAAASNIDGGVEPEVTFYKWKANESIDGQPQGSDANTKTITAADEGKTITCEITCSEPDGSEPVINTATYAKTPINPTIDKPTITAPLNNAGIGNNNAPKADEVTFISDAPSGSNINTWGEAQWRISRNESFTSIVFSKNKSISVGTNQTLTPAELNGALQVDTTYWVKVTYTSSSPLATPGVSDAVTFKTAALPDGWNYANIDYSGWGNTTYFEKIKHICVTPSGRFVAVHQEYQGGKNAILYSDDGINWSTVKVSSNVEWNTVKYGNGILMLMGGYAQTNNGDPLCLISTDEGETWNPPPGDSWRGGNDVEYGNGMWLTTSTNGKIYQSTDNGTSWNLVNELTNFSPTKIAYGNGTWVVLDGDGYGTSIKYSNDGLSWTDSIGYADSTLDESYLTNSLAWKYIMHDGYQFWVSNSYPESDRFATSYDGSEWYNEAVLTYPNGDYRGEVGAIINGKVPGIGYRGRTIVFTDYRAIMYAEGYIDTFTRQEYALPQDINSYDYLPDAGAARPDMFVASFTFSVNNRGAIIYSYTGKKLEQRIIAYDTNYNETIGEEKIIHRYGVDPTADLVHLGVYPLTEEVDEAHRIECGLPSGDKYTAVRDYSLESEDVKKEAARATSRIAAAEDTIETIRDDFEARISALENA